MARAANETASVRTIRRRNWADILVIVFGVWALGEAAWGPTLFTQNTNDPGAGYTQVAFVVGGLLAVLGMFVAQRRRSPGRAMIAVGGLLCLAVPLAYHAATPWMIMGTAVLIGVVLIVGSFFAGPIPRDIP